MMSSHTAASSEAPIQRPAHPVRWRSVGSALFDMDGTLLDLHFDNHFWFEHLPKRLAQIHDLDLGSAAARVSDHIEAHRGTLAWYCLDHWGRELELDLVALKCEVQHLIQVHPNVPRVLAAVRRAGKRTVLVTNAHAASLALKLERTQLVGHFDRVVCAHDLGLPKESPQFWGRLKTLEDFEPSATVLVDDNADVLRSARAFGISQLVLARRPDSTQAPSREAEFPGITDFAELLPVTTIDAGARKR